MKPRALPIAVLALLFAAACGALLHCRAAPPPPNLILITADDLSWDDSEPYGHPRLRTPALMRLAAEGMRFDQAILTSASCSPSRCSTLTGRYPHSTGAGRLHDALPPEQITILEGLRRAGYFTAVAGKWHLGKAAHSRFDKIYPEEGPSGCDLWLNALRERPRDRPFFLWLSAADPHRPYTPEAVEQPHAPEDAVVPPYLPDVTETRLDLANYYDAVERLDRQIGRVLDELDRQSLVRDTFVLFMSDNGRPFPRCKPTLYDGGIRTPLIARFPDRIRPGSRSGSLVSAVDLAPTLLELAGVPRPATIQGVSLLPLFDDPDATVREHAFAEHNWHDTPARERMVRTRRFKYIRNYYQELPATPPSDVMQSPTYHAMQVLNARSRLTLAQANLFVAPRPAEELYDLEADPFELENRADQKAYATTLGEMRQALQEWERTTEDRDTEGR